eukprot:PhF_6_TR39723/c0_g1_i2/m.59147
MLSILIILLAVAATHSMDDNVSSLPCTFIIKGSSSTHQEILCDILTNSSCSVVTLLGDHENNYTDPAVVISQECVLSSSVTLRCDRHVSLNCTFNQPCFLVAESGVAVRFEGCTFYGRGIRISAESGVDVSIQMCSFNGGGTQLMFEGEQGLRHVEIADSIF